MMEKQFEHQKIVVEILDYAFGGAGFGRLADGRPVFVPYTMPGDQVKARLLTQRKDYCTARLEEIIAPSPQRITPRCPHFMDCGGCHYQHLAYGEQLVVKQKIVENQLRRIGKFSDLKVNDVIPSPEQWKYRNTMQFHVSSGGRLGLKAWDGARVAEVSECHLPAPDINDLWPLLDIDPQSGVSRVVLRTDSFGQPLAALEGQEEAPPEFSVDFPLTVHYLSRGGDTLLAGDTHNHMEVNGERFAVSPRSFFQVNLPQAEAMVAYFLENVPLTANDTVFDLYSGVGLFSAFLAPRVKEVIAVESSESACEDYAINLNEHENVSLYIGDVERVLPGLDVTPDVVLMDPPRAGLGNAVIDRLVKRPARDLAYVSCDPATMARDLKQLVEGGYVINSIQPFDLFPQTYHVECVVLMTSEMSSERE